LNSGTLFFQQKKQVSWCPDQGERRRALSRGQISVRLGKTDEAVLDIFLFIKIEVPLWGRKIFATAKIYSRANIGASLANLGPTFLCPNSSLEQLKILPAKNAGLR